MLFEPKEHGSMGLSGEDRIPVWNRLQIELEKRGWKPYITALFRTADTFAEVNTPFDPRESELQQILEKDFYSKHLTYRMVQMAPLALLKHLTNPTIPPEPINIGVTFTFTYDMLNNHTMRVIGQEETFNGSVPGNFLNLENSEDQTIHNAIIQAMLRPQDFT